MPLYEITAPDGSVYEIEGPEGASQQSLVLAAKRYERQKRSEELQRRVAEARQRPEEPPETTFGGQAKELFKGVVPGAIGLAETAGTGIAALLPEDTEKSVRAKLKEIAGIAKKPFEAAPGYEDTVGRKFGEALGSTLPFFALGPAGLAGRAAASGVGVAAGAGEAREAAEAKGATAEERRLATQLGAPTGLLDILAPNIGPIRGIITTALARGGVEGATEAAQKVAQNLIAKGVYDPSQPVLAGSGEEGAYGAGVGALSSLILDMALGRRAKTRTAPGEEKPAGQQLLGYDKEPFTPVTTPDGSVITTKAEYDQYIAGKEGTARQREEDRRTSDPLAGLSTFDRNLARTGKEAALTETFTSQEPDLFGELVPKREEAITKPVEEPTPNKVVRDDRTRDMIEEAETADIKRMVAEEEAVPREKERLKFESDLAEIDGRLQAKQEKTAEDNRMAVLLPIIEDPKVQNIGPAFQAELRRQGFTSTEPTAREQNLIQRATDLRLAEKPAPAGAPAVEEGEPLPAAPAENAAMEAAIPERKAKREPEQMGFPGMGKPKGPAPQAFSEEELAAQKEQPFTGRSGEAPRSYTSKAPFSTVLTPEALDKTGLPKQSGFYRELVNKDMADPAQQPAVASVLARVRTNPNLSPATKQAIERVAMQAFGGLAKQGEMFGPRGGVLEPSTTKESKRGTPSGRGTDTGDVGAGTGASVRGADTGKPAGERTGERTDTTRAKAPESAGLGDRGQPAGVAGSGKTVESGALKEPTKVTAKVATAEVSKRGAKAETKVEPKTEPKTEAKTEPKKQLTAREMLDRAEDAQRKADAEKAKTEAKKEPKQPKRTADQEEAAGNYMVAAKNNAADAVRFLAHDLYIATYPQKNVSKELNVIVGEIVAGRMPDLKFGKEGASGFPGTGGKYAKAFYESLSPADKARLFKDLENYFITWEAKTTAVMSQINAQQELDRATKEQMDNLELPFDQAVMMRALHPGIVAELKGGNLTGALRILANQNQGRPSQIAQRLLDAIGSTKVQIVSGLKQDGKPVAGLYDPKTDTIKLDADSLGTHGLLHEAVHAATSHVLDNKSHPLTKQLTELYNNVKDSLDTAYGARTLDEFVAESFSNPEFQAKLAAINPKGEPISALQRFFTAVGNFIRRMLGMDTKGPGTALDATDVLVNQILSPAPESRGGAPLALAALFGKGKDVLDGMGTRAMNAPRINDAWKARAHEFFTGSVPNTVKSIVRSALPLNALVEVAEKYIPMASKLDVLVGERAGTENKRHQAIEPVVKRVEAWAKSNPNLVDTLNNVIYTSTLEQVDPSKPRSEYTKDAEKLKQWDAMQAGWTKLGTEGQSVYNQMRDTYKKMYEDVKAVLDNRIDSALEDKATANKVKAEIYQRLFASGHIEPYFPLTRSGKYWLSYSAIDPRNGNKEFYVEAYETSYERDQAVKELQADKSAKAEDIQKFANLSQVNYRKTPATSFVNSILRTMEANKVDAEVTEEVMRLFLNTLPETSFAQSFRRRKGTLGFQHDAIGALRSKTYSLARQLSNMEYGAKFEKLRADMKDYVRSQGNKEEAVEYMNELDKRIDYAISPDIPQWSKLATSFGFNMTLGFNVSSALINMSQIPLVVMPYLGGKYGYGVTSVALGRAARIFTGSGFDREVEMLVPTDKGEKKVKVRAFPSMDNYDFSKNPDLKHLETLVRVASARGQLNRSQMYDILDVDESNNLLTKVNAASGFVFHHAERMNRQVALIAAYELELNQMRKDGRKIDAKAEQEAADYAVYVTELTNGGTAAAAAPRIAQSALGKVVFMYKRYGVSMYYMLYKTARDALASQDPKVQAAAKKQIAGIYASAALMAGVQGIPMFGVAAMLYNLILKGEDDDDFDTAARKWMGETIYSGLGNAVFGVELASRMGLSDLLFRDTTTKPSDSVMLSLMEQMGGPVFGVASRMERGLKLIADGNVERGVEQMMPSAIGNGLKAVRFGTEGANTLRGDPITGEIGPWNTFAQFFGFAPAEYTRQLEINSSLKNIERAAVEERTKLLRKYYIAMRNGDGAEAADITKKMLEYNKKHPGAAITPDTVKSSMAQHMRTTAQMYHGITLNKALRPELLRNAAEYDSDEE